MIHRPHHHARGFTLVEVLVVIAIIAVLIGLVVGGVWAAGRSARKTQEMNDIRQVGIAWQQYSSTYDSRLIPGWIDVEVQEAWNVKYKDAKGDRLDPDYCRSYPWRLLPFLGYNFRTLYDYLERDAADWNGQPALVADNPAFGVNAYYVGGWMQPYSSGPGVPVQGRPVYANASYEGSSGNMVSGRLVCQTQESIRRPSELLVFTSSGYREPGFYKDDQPSYSPGAAWVVPPRLGTQDVWELSYGDVFQSLTVGSGMLASTAAAGIRVFQTQAVPVSKNNGISVLRADLSVGSAGLDQLMDMSNWIDVAFKGANDGLTFNHTD